MTKKHWQDPFDEGDFTIQYPPDSKGNGLVDGQCNVGVVVINDRNATPPFMASILSPTGTTISSTQLDNPAPDVYTGSLNVRGYAGQNLTVSVTSKKDQNNRQSFQAVYAGSGSGSGCGSGSAFVALSGLGASIPTMLYAHVSNAGALSGVYELVYDLNRTAWLSDAVSGSLVFRLRCVGLKWQLTVMAPRTYQPSVTQCGPSPPLQLVFDDVDLTRAGRGEAANAVVEILLSPG